MMNNSLFRLSAFILCIESIFSLLVFVPLIIETYNPSAFIPALLIAIAILLLIIAGIGLFTAKRWPLVSLWLALLVSLFVSIFYGRTLPSFAAGNFETWIIDLIIAIYLSLYYRRTSLEG